MNEYVWKVYKVASPCGRAYIGITRTTMAARWKSHERAAKTTRIPFYDAILEHGGAAFKIEILTECYSEWEARKCERAMIALHDTYYKNGNGFNRSIGGNGSTGGTSEETRAKLRAAAERNKDAILVRILGASKKYNEMGRPVSEEGRARKNIGLAIGRAIPRTPEQIEATRLRMTGYPQPPEWKAKSQKNAAKARGCITDEARKRGGDSLRKLRADPEIAALMNHRFWATLQYQQALANRIGRHRPYKAPLPKRGHADG